MLMKNHIIYPGGQSSDRLGKALETRALRINNELVRAGWSASRRNLVEEFPDRRKQIAD
ncbi:MAG: hypothetical protein ACREI9_12420 [Nitrospiraceae bacterium]